MKSGSLEGEWKVIFESRHGNGGIKTIIVRANSFEDAKFKGWKESKLTKKQYAFLTEHEYKSIGGVMLFRIASAGYNINKIVTDKKHFEYSIGGL